MPEWQIEFKEYLERLKIKERDFNKKLRMPKISNIKRIVPMRGLKSILALIPIHNELLLQLISGIKTLDGQKPFENADISILKLDSRSLKIGQKFVYRENYQKLLEEVPGIFSRFAILSGLEDLGAYFAFGWAENEEISKHSLSLAIYLPPLVEKHGSSLIIMDGIHRNFIAKQTGATPTSLIIENVEVPFPCTAKSWPEIRVIPLIEKPGNINERYFNLKKELFRDLKYLGIDG